MEQWLTHLVQSDYQIMCMGELHEEPTRNFLAEEFFVKFSTDVLLLEATPKNLKRLIKRMDAGRDYFPLLNADIMKILRTVKNRNPAIKIWGLKKPKSNKRILIRETNPLPITSGTDSKWAGFTLFCLELYIAQMNRIGFSKTSATRIPSI